MSRPARLLGLVAVCLFAAVVAPPLAPVPLAAAAIRRSLVRRAATRRARAAVVDEMPEVVDLIALVVGSGANVAAAVEAVAPRAPPSAGAALTAVLVAMRRGERLADALEQLPAALGEPVRPLTAALVAAERYGAPLLPVLDRLAAEARADRRRRAEEAARRIPVALLFPLVACVLPAFGVLTLVPLLAGALGSLGR